MSGRALIWFTALSMLTGCASGMQPTPANPPGLRPRVAESLLLHCGPLPEIEDGKLATLIENHLASVQLYHACSARHAALVEAVRAMQGAAAPGRLAVPGSEAAGAPWTMRGLLQSFGGPATGPADGAGPADGNPAGTHGSGP